MREVRAHNGQVIGASCRALGKGEYGPGYLLIYPLVPCSCWEGVGEALVGPGPGCW